jgi:broad specificity phosphatase PhoE
MPSKWFPVDPTFLALPQLQECSNDPCDTGSSLDILKKHFPEVEFRDELFDSEDWLNKSHGTPYDWDFDMLAKRAKFVRDYIRQQPDCEIIVMTHGGFARFMVNRWNDGPGWDHHKLEDLQNAQGAPFHIVDCSNGEHEMRYLHESSEDCDEISQLQ